MADANGIVTLTKRLRWRATPRPRQSGPVTALDIDGAVLRVAVGMRRGDRADFTRIVSAPLQFPPDADRADPNVLGKAISAALETLRLKPSAVVMGVPRGKVMLRTLSLPDLGDVRELASMVQLQVGKDLPYRREDAVIDFHVRRVISEAATTASPVDPKGGESKLQVVEPAKVEALVAVVKRDVIEFYRNVASAAGFKLVALGLLPHANAQVAALSHITDGEQPVALISLRSEEVTVEIISGGTLLFSREAQVTDNHHEEPAEPVETPVPPAPEPSPASENAAAVEPVYTNGKLSAVERITIEVVRSLHSFGGMVPDRPVTKLFVTGGTGQDAEIAAGLEKRIAIPVAVLDLPKDLGLDAADRDTSAAVSAIGLALAATDPSGAAFNFLDPKRPAVQRNMKRIRTLAALAAVAVLFACIFGVRSYLEGKRKEVQARIQKEISDLAKHQPVFRRTRAQAATIQSWMTEEKDWLEHYAYLSAVLPGSHEIYITSLSVSPQGTIRLAVQARSGEVLAKLDKQLRDAGYEVKPQAITPGADRYGYNFRSSVELIVPAKMKIDLSKVKAPARPADDVSLNPPGKGSVTVKREVGRATLSSARRRSLPTTVSTLESAARRAEDSVALPITAPNNEQTVVALLTRGGSR